MTTCPLGFDNFSKKIEELRTEMLKEIRGSEKWLLKKMQENDIHVEKKKRITSTEYAEKYEWVYDGYPMKRMIKEIYEAGEQNTHLFYEELMDAALEVIKWSTGEDTTLGVKIQKMYYAYKEIKEHNAKI